MKNNGFIIALTLWERIMPILRLDKREQINRGNLKLVYDYTGHIVSQLNSVSFDDDIVMGNLLKASNIEDMLLKNPMFKETDTDIKNELGRLYKCSDSVYLSAGQFYMDNEFDYSPKYKDILNEIIRVNINAGFYFGYSA